jgi:TonB family protein
MKMKPLKLALLLSSCAMAISLVTWSVIDGVARMRSAGAMAEAANKFLASLTPEQKAKASFEFGDAQRFDWHFIPRDRKGIPLKDLDENQRKLAMEFMKTGLGAAGYQKATTIMSLEPVLAQMEGPSRRFPRDPELYYFSVFGTPSAKDPWGWRVEGHHLSLNFTVAKGELVSNAPLFFGANPAEVREGERKGLRALAAEEDKGRDLILALDEKQRAIAIFDKTAPGDIITMNLRKADPLKPDGIAASKLNKQQTALLEKLIDEYLSRMPQDIADERSKNLRLYGFDKIHFAWADGMNKGDPHYYRIQGPKFLVEYDNTQNNANHIHSVWRDFDGDFGADLLSIHYFTSQHGGFEPIQQMGDGVSRPSVTYRERAEYTPEACRNKVKGVVALAVVFGLDGKIRDIRVIKRLPDGLTEKAIEAVAKTRFNPAMKDKQPVNVRVLLEYVFDLPQPCPK